MKIAYYMPFKPMGHSNPSGDLIIGTELYSHLAARNHTINLVSNLRCRWIYYKPFSLLRLFTEKRRILKQAWKSKPDLWLSYHSYYKAPDLLGSACSRKLGIPYVIFQGIYSTKRRRRLHSLPGFLLNRKVLLSADHIFTNKKRDLINLKRLLPENRLSYIAPGIQPQFFKFSPDSRNKLRKRWSIRDETVIMTAAMMRPGVKGEGIDRVIESCSQLIRQGMSLRLIIAGDGSCRQQLEEKAAKLLQNRVTFLGKVPRQALYQYYSSADIFAFPGIEESLGMVYLEAQSCLLPVVAYQDWGAGEAVIHQKTGLVSPAANHSNFTENIKTLIKDTNKRKKLAFQAGDHIRCNHNLEDNYNRLEKKLADILRSQR